MGSKKVFLKNLTAIRQFPRQEIPLRLSRLVEGFQYSSGKTLGVEPNELCSVLRSCLAYCQGLLGPYANTLSTSELSAIVDIFIFLHKLEGAVSSSSGYLVEAKSLCESLLRHNSNLLTVANLEKGTVYLAEFASQLVVAGAEEQEDAEQKDFLWLWQGLQFSFLNPGSCPPRDVVKALCSVTRVVSLLPPNSSLGVSLAPQMLPLLIQWLQGTEVSQASALQTLEDTRTTASSSQRPVTELDQSAHQERFTILNVGKFLTATQLLHVEVFACAKAWLRYLLQSQSNVPSAVQEPRLVSALQELSVYMLRVLEQCENQWRRSPSHRDLLQCTLCEVVEVLQPLCHLHPASVSRLFPRSQDLYRALASEWPPLLHAKWLPFFYTHAARVGQPAGGYLTQLLGEVTAVHYRNADFTHELVHFMRENAKHLAVESSLGGVLARYFPAVAKVFVWNPQVWSGEFYFFLATFVTSRTALEVLHYLLDLPCIAAAMEHSISSTTGNPRTATATTPEQQGYLDFLLRSQSCVMGDTLSRMNRIYPLLNPYRHSLRVLYNCDMALALLPCYFNLVLLDDSGAANSQQWRLHVPQELAVEVVRIVLERCTLSASQQQQHADEVWYGPTAYGRQAVQLLGRTLAHFFRGERRARCLLQVLPEAVDLLRGITSVKAMITQEAILTALLHALGLACNSLNKAERLSHWSNFLQIYEVLEACVLECISVGISGLLAVAQETSGQSGVSVALALLSQMASCLVRLAVMFPERHANCMVLLTKLHNFLGFSVATPNAGLTLELVRERVEELLEMLSFDNMDAVLLTGSCSRAAGESDATTDPGRRPQDQHRDAACVTTLIKEIDALFHHK